LKLILSPEGIAARRHRIHLVGIHGSGPHLSAFAPAQPQMV
jgi:hypothetical protein